MEESKINLKTGDLVTFFSEQEEEDGYFCKEHDNAILSSNKSKDCVFKIYPFTQYTARKALKKKAKKKLQQQQQQQQSNSDLKDNIFTDNKDINNNNNNNNKDDNGATANGTEITDLELKQLEEYQDLEDVNNESTLIQLEGRDLVYGQIVQLYQPSTNQFLFAKGEKKSQSTQIVGFRQDGDQKCYFKITPRFQNLDGSKVYSDDLVLLRHEKTGLFLKETNSSSNGQGVDIGLSESGTYWKMSISDVDGKSGLNTLKQNVPFRLFHREGGFVKVSNDKTTFSYNTKTPSSINSLFEIEFEILNSPNVSRNNTTATTGSSSNSTAPTPGSTPTKQDKDKERDKQKDKDRDKDKEIQIQQQQYLSNEVHFYQNFWIKLVGTRKYLSLCEPSDDASKESPLVVVPEDQKYSPNSTFCFIPRDKSSTTNIDDILFGSFVRIQSQSKQFLHFISDETFHHNGELVGSKKYYKNDDFQIKQIPKSQLDDYSFVQSRIFKIQTYLLMTTQSNSSQSLNSSTNSTNILNLSSTTAIMNPNYMTSMVGQPLISTTTGLPLIQKKITIQEIKVIIVEFIKFCTQSEVEDPLDREGTPIKTHQKLLSHPSHFLVILEYLKRLFEPWDAASILFVYRLLKQMAKSNVKNGIIINGYLDQISPPSIREKTIPLHFGAILYEVYKNNNILLEALTENKVLEFIDVIKVKKEPKYMELLSEICTCFGKPIVKNQQYLCDILIEKNSSLLFNTRVVGANLEIERASGKWVDISSFALSVDEKTHRFFEQTLSLYANVSKGRNYNGIRLVGQRTSHKECLIALKEESLPYSLRGCYINILIHVYMDCHPQTYVPQINYIWHPSIFQKLKISEFLTLYQQQQQQQQQQVQTQQPNNFNNIILNPNGSINGNTITNSGGFMPNVTPNYSNQPTNLTLLQSSVNHNQQNNINPQSVNNQQSQHPQSNLLQSINNSNLAQSISVLNQNNLVTSTNQQPQNNLVTSTNQPATVTPNNSQGSNILLQTSSSNSNITTQNSLAIFKEDEIFSTFSSEIPQDIKEPSTTTQLLINLLSKSEYFSNINNTFPTSFRPQLSFFHKILIAVGYAFKFGFFKNKERLLMKRLIYILNFEHEPQHTSNYKEIDLGRTMGGSRMLEDDSIIFVNIKIEILNILHLMLSLQKKNIMDVFLYDFSNMNISAFYQPDSVKDLLVEKLKNNYQRDAQQDLKLCNDLLKLLKHENNHLSSLSLSLLNRIYKYRSIYSMLWGPIQKLFILSNDLTLTYQESLQKMKLLTETCFVPLLDDKKTDQSLKSLAYFIHLCTDNDPSKLLKNQKLLKGLNIHKTIISILKIGCSLDELILNETNQQQQQQLQQQQQTKSSNDQNDDSNTSNSTITTTTTTTTNNSNLLNFKSILNNNFNSNLQSIFVSKIFKSCYEFLKVFCRDNDENQRVLFTEIEFLIGHLIRYGNVFGTVETLIEIFKNNLELCIQFGISPYLKILINFIINLSIEQLDPLFLRLLSILILPGGDNSVIENQIVVTNLLKENKSKISKLLININIIKDVMKDSKLLTKYYNVNNSNQYKLHLALKEILNTTLLENFDGASLINPPQQQQSITQQQGNNQQSKLPKLIRSSAKAQILNSSVETLPKEFVINLELILLLKACSHGKNTPTEVICREFLSMAECFDVLVVRSDGNGKENSSMMIHESTNEYLENNLLFRFKSAYLSFLHEVFFNSDTLKGDLLALQLNQDLWSLIDQFTNQLNQLYISSIKNQLSDNYYIQMSRNIVLPMLSVLERFYSQCFYFDKATQVHLQYSGRLMATLMKLYWVDPSLAIPFSNQSTSRYQSVVNLSLQPQDQIDPSISSGGLHPIIHGLDIEEKISIFSNLTKCLKAMDRSALSPVTSPNVSILSITEVIDGCEKVIKNLEGNSIKLWGNNNGAGGGNSPGYGRIRSETIDSSSSSSPSSPSSPIIKSSYNKSLLLNNHNGGNPRENNFVKLSKIRGYTEIAQMINQSIPLTPHLLEKLAQQEQQHQQEQQNQSFSNSIKYNTNGSKKSRNNSLNFDFYQQSSYAISHSRDNSFSGGNNPNQNNNKGNGSNKKGTFSLRFNQQQQQLINLNNQQAINQNQFIQMQQQQQLNLANQINNQNQNGSITNNLISQSINQQIQTYSSNNSIQQKQSFNDKSINYLEILVFQLRNSLYNNDKMKLNCIRILLSLLYINKERKRIIQNIMADLYCHSAVIGLLSSNNTEISFESLALLLALLDDSVSIDNPTPNYKVKDDIQSHFSSSPDIQFFRDIFNMVERAKINLKDTKRNIHRFENNKFGGTVNISGAISSTIKNRNSAINLNNQNQNNALIESNPYATEFQLLSNIFRVLQLLCQGGSSNIFKKNIRSQPDNYKSYDILKELCQFLKILETIVSIDKESIELGLRFFSCMKEIVKNTPENQIAVTNVQVCKAVCNILKKETDPTKELKESKYLDLKIEVVDFLLHVIDKEDPRVISKLIPELDYNVIEFNTKLISTQKSNNEINEKSIKLASMSFRLIKILADNDKSQNRKLVECLLKCGEHCKSRIGRVELFYKDKLERIYFPIPNYSRRLILEDKEQSKIKSDENLLQGNLEEHFINNKISWNKATEKLDGFIDWSEYKLIELEHIHKLKLNSLSYLLVSHSDKFKFLSFFLALVINLLLVIFSKGDTRTDGFKNEFGKIEWFSAFLPIAVLQTIFCILSCVGFFLRKGPVLLYQNWVSYLKYHNHKKTYMFHTNDQRMESLRQNFKYKFILLNIKFILLDLKSLYNILSVICSIFGLAISPYFFAFHIFQFSLNTKALSLVIKAITLNKKSLIVMGIFILQATYLLSIFSFVYFQDKYRISVSDADEDVMICHTLLQCFISNLYYGVPSSGQLIQFLKFDPLFVNDTTSPVLYSTNSQTAKVIGWTVYNIAFYVIVTLVLLNVILGIIVDTFGQLRDQRAETEEYKNNVCFICSIEREYFQKKSIDFNKHIEDDHNKWHYLYFFAYLKERITNNQLNQLSELEASVADGITNRNYISYFPDEMAMSLQGIENERKKSDPIDQVSKSFDEIEKRITSNMSNQFNQSITLLIDEIKNLRQQISDLKQQ